MTRPSRAALLFTAALACGGRARTPDDGATRRFAEEARAATQRYRSQSIATAEGYRRVGTDFPSMGEHWVNLAQVMADSFTPARPSVLTYVHVNGTPRLAGVAYTALLEPDERPPDFAPARGHWHEHNGSIVEESFLAGHHMSRTDGELRLSILHAWIWEENPDGLFVTDNWRLPFLRLGAMPPPRATPAAARAAALATDAVAYYRLALDEALAPAPVEGARIDTVLAEYGRRARLTVSDADRLLQVWTAMWESLEQALPRHTKALRELRRRIS